MSLYKDITENEMKIVLNILKSPHIMYNANSISKVSGISSMGALKILKKLEKESILIPKKIGRSVIYKIDTANDYSKNYVKFLLSRESTSSSGAIKRWINEIKKIKSADMAILFGSILKDKEPDDIDVLFVVSQKKFENLKNEVKEINEINIKKIHPVYQSPEDIINNIKKKDKVVLNAIKGIIVLGEDKFLEIYNESRKE